MQNHHHHSSNTLVTVSVLTLMLFALVVALSFSFTDPHFGAKFHSIFSFSSRLSGFNVSSEHRIQGKANNRTVETLPRIQTIHSESSNEAHFRKLVAERREFEGVHNGEYDNS